MSTLPDIQESMAGLALSGPAAQSSQDDEAATGCIAAGSEASGAPETKIATALLRAKEGDYSIKHFKQRRNGFDLIKKACKDFIDDEWLVMGVKSQIDNPGEKYLAIHVSLLETTWIVDDASGGAPASDTPNVTQVLTIAPVVRNERNSDDIPVPYEEDKKSMCIHIGSTGLSGWFEAWETKNENGGFRDRVDRRILTLRASGDSWVGSTEIERFSQRKFGSYEYTTDEEPGLQVRGAWLRPKPFSAWRGTDTQDARQRARNNTDKPDIRVGLRATLYTLYTPARTERNSKTDATAGTSSDN